MLTSGENWERFFFLLLRHCFSLNLHSFHSFRLEWVTISFPLSNAIWASSVNSISISSLKCSSVIFSFLPSFSLFLSFISCVHLSPRFKNYRRKKLWPFYCTRWCYNLEEKKINFIFIIYHPLSDRHSLESTNNGQWKSSAFIIASLCIWY